MFGVPGDTGVALYDALARQEQVRHVLARDERSAAYMADAYARVTNRLGVVEASSGGGVTYLVGGLGEAYAASVPVLVITSDIHRSSRGSGALTEIDQVALFAAVTKRQWRIERAGDIPGVQAVAIREALSGRPGPVSVIVPEDVLTESGGDDVAMPPARLGGERPEADPEPLAQAAEWLTTAMRPAMVLGSGVHLAGAWSEARGVAEAAAIPVATTLHGKGAFPDDHPLSLGVVGDNGGRDYANAWLSEADVVLFVGTRANATDTSGFRAPSRQGVQVIHLDIDPGRAGRNYPGSIRLIGDARAGLSALQARLAGGDFEERRQRVSRQIAGWRAAWEQEQGPPPEDALDPRLLVEAVTRLVGPEATVVADPGTPTPYVGAFWQAAGDRRSVVIPRGHGPMGFALPAGLGVALARPGRPVVVLTTDGSFGMACGELETLARLDLPVTCIHMTNGSLGWIKALQHFYADGRYFGVDLGPVDAVRVAEGFGVRALRARTVGDVEMALGRSLDDGRPTFIDVAVPEEFAHIPPVAPWKATLTGALHRPIY
jgi:acetolactate synthase I/II/III large subunit